ncbi:helix-turn-helix transcriptional regulator [Chitinophaga sp. CB10]|uniref:helix-turn-helix domain-containing protein n=1 Tax=Chitinophaga sp. CB10 TaxID=1891659 RepID=UPI0025C12C99|nr:helix-turn-helix transcriptional regulator [Chitinophaga sp. CB10]
MKPQKDIEKKHTNKELAASIVFPGPQNLRDREDMLSALKEIRKRKKQEQTDDSKLIAQLLQLKFLMEDYLNDKALNQHLYFGYFLKEYIVRLEKKYKQFAEEIDVNPTELSQIINRHRNPTDKIIYRLEIHSNRNFPAIMWFRILEKQREYELMHDASIVNSEKSHVKKQLSFSL